MSKTIKIIVIFLSVLLVSGACDKDTDRGDGSIGFSAEVTKSLVDDVTDVQTDGISLFAVRTSSGAGGTATTTPFINRKLSYSSNSWTYAGSVEYWIPGSTYDFISIYPYSSSDYTFSYADKTVSFNFTTPNPYPDSYSAAAVNDVMYSYYNRSYSDGGDTSPVPISLTHTCSMLTFTIRNVSAQTISVSNISLSGLYTQGTCTVGSSVSWACTGSMENTTTTRYRGVTSGLSNLPINANVYYQLFPDKILAVPQPVSTNSSIVLNLTVTMDDDHSSSDISAHLANTSAITRWEPNKSYNYVITVTEERILFEVELIDWVDNNVNL